jgi:hypothetical protein
VVDLPPPVDIGNGQWNGSFPARTGNPDFGVEKSRRSLGLYPRRLRFAGEINEDEAPAITATSKTASAVPRVKDLRFIARYLRTRINARDWLLIVRFADQVVRSEQTESAACT